MRKCLYCHKGIHDDDMLIAVYDNKTRYVLFFCSWWHTLRWYMKDWLKRVFKHKGSAE